MNEALATFVRGEGQQESEEAVAHRLSGVLLRGRKGCTP